jgi:hypothetical protein
MAHKHRHSGRGDPSLARLAQGLGWFSIGLGVTELVAPERLARFLGMEESSGLIRTYGAREILTGVGILAQDDPTPWLWGRVVGDALDLATLAPGLYEDNPRRGNVALAVGAIAGVMALDLYCAQALRNQVRRPPRRRIRDYSGRRGMPRPPAEMRGLARDFEVPRDMRIPEPMRPYPT